MANIAIGPALKALRERSGVSMRQLAVAMGYKNPSSVQHIFDDHYREGKELPLDVARKLGAALIGKGSPPIQPEEIFSLTGMATPLPSGAPVNEAVAFPVSSEQLPPSQVMPKDIPVYGTALGAPLSLTEAVTSGGVTVAIEQVDLHTAEPIEYLRRTPALAGRKNIYGVYVVGSSMSPRHEEADVLLVDPHRPPANGDDVIVQLRAENGHDGEDVVAALIKRLVRRNSQFVELEQFNPPASFRLEADRVKSVHRVIPLKEMIGF